LRAYSAPCAFSLKAAVRPPTDWRRRRLPWWGFIRSLEISVSELKVIRGFQAYEGKTTPGIHVRGKAWLENCNIGLAVEKEMTRACSFVAGPVHPDDAQHEWNVSFGFIEADWEIGNEDDWFIQGYIPEAVFDEFVTAFKAGEANALTLRCRANLWAESWVRYAPISEHIAWKLSQDNYGAGMAQGKIESFSWEVQSKRPKREETEAFKAGQGLADETVRTALEDVPTPQPTPPQRSKWGWWVVAAAAVILFLVLRKNG
jgi:hypothetical protein